MANKVADESSAFENEVRALFSAYLSAFQRQLASAISEMWDEVSLFPSLIGNFSIDREAFLNHCVTLLNFYEKLGVAEPTGHMLSAAELLAGVAQARMAYEMLGPDGTPLANWEHVYILRMTDGKWRVSLTIPDDEMAAWAAARAEL